MTGGLALRKRREQLGWRVDELAAELGCTPRAIHRWERGERNPSAPMIDAIRQLLGLQFQPERKAKRRPASRVAGLPPLRALKDAPCIEFACAHRERCRVHHLACEDYATWQAYGTGRPLDSPKPTREIYLRVFRTEDETE